jgi:hypothetical protein
MFETTPIKLLLGKLQDNPEHKILINKAYFQRCDTSDELM